MHWPGGVRGANRAIEDRAEPSSVGPHDSGKPPRPTPSKLGPLSPPHGLAKLPGGYSSNQPDRFSDWLEQSKTTELRPFATSLQRDESAGRAALELPWSNRPVEGHVHRLKLIKRQMFGRAKFELLRKRRLYQAA
jgi:hypothetical protein